MREVIRIARYLERAAPFIAANYPEFLARCEHGKNVQARARAGARKTAKLLTLRPNRRA